MAKETNFEGARLVSGAILGYDFRRVMVGGECYTINPPTIERMCGAGYWLSSLEPGESLREMLMATKDWMALCRALSWMVEGGEGLAEALSKGTPDEVVKGLEAAYCNR